MPARVATTWPSRTDPTVNLADGHFLSRLLDFLSPAAAVFATIALAFQSSDLQRPADNLRLWGAPANRSLSGIAWKEVSLRRSRHRPTSTPAPLTLTLEPCDGSV